MDEIIIDKSKTNPLVMKAVKKIGKTNDEIGRKIGKSAMVFTQIKNQRNLVGFETLALMRKAYGLNLNAVVDEDEAHLFSEYNFDEILARLDAEKKEKDEMKRELDSLKEEYGAFKKMALANFPNVCTNDHLTDNIEAVNQLGDVKKNFWTSHIYLADMIDLTRND